MVAFQLFVGLFCAFSAGLQAELRNYGLMTLLVSLAIVNTILAVGRIIS